MKKPSPKVLRLLAWVMEKPAGRRLVTQSSGNEVWLFDAVGAEPDGRPILERTYPSSSLSDDTAMKRDFGGSMAMSITDLLREGLLDHQPGSWSFGDKTAAKARQDFLDGYSGHGLPDRGTVAWANERTVAWWADVGRALHEEAAATRAEKTAATRRTVLIGARADVRFDPPAEVRAMLPEGMTAPGMRVRRVVPYILAKVVKETGQRLYVEDVEYLPYDTSLFEISGGGIVKGYRPNEYVETHAVMIEHVSPAKARRLAAAQAEYAADLKDIHAQMLREIMPVLESFGSRLLQKIAERDDVLEEIMRGDAG